jgi:inositol phosphorylceramide mannosyltransferase catalytic subunit
MSNNLLLKNKQFYYVITLLIILILILNWKTVGYFLNLWVKTLINRENNTGIKLGQYDFKSQKLRNSLITSKKIKGIDNNIFQIFLNQDEVPVEILENITKLKLLNPNWKYYLITDENVDENIKIFDDEKFSEVYYDINDNYPAVKSDLLRYMLLYKYGGVYLDIKSFISKPIDDIITEGKINIYKWCFLEYPLVCGWRRKMDEFEIAQFILMYPNGNYFLRTLLDNIYNKFTEYKTNKTLKQIVFEFTGPIIYTNTISSIKDKDNSVVLYNFKDSGIIYNVLKHNHKDYYKTVHYSNISSNILK